MPVAMMMHGRALFLILIAASARSRLRLQTTLEQR